MIPLESLPLEEDDREHSEDDKCYHLLQDFQLHESERSSVLAESQSVCRDLETVFEQSDAPRQKYNGKKRPVGCDLHFLKLEMAVPCECHEYIGTEKKQYGI